MGDKVVVVETRNWKIRRELAFKAVGDIAYSKNGQYLAMGNCSGNNVVRLETANYCSGVLKSMVSNLIEKTGIEPTFDDNGQIYDKDSANEAMESNEGNNKASGTYIGWASRICLRIISSHFKYQ